MLRNALFVLFAYNSKMEGPNIDIESYRAVTLKKKRDVARSFLYLVAKNALPLRNNTWKMFE